ncbi:metallo-beta-lactamase domain-containing protein 2 isoform X4 [Mesocricetus auratus]|uniref:Metallo-beta-lactamase domain-containing protein 2 isoform X4 n=1 Tax=Mesocricetus auratus TaxID=10036 RepID=A0ABM2WA91_MESAU|nr:metallo-beta-lactamase domain-containing protein 2 isoform X4 [Mesocricetus auratus]
MSALEWYAHKSLGDGIFWIQERFYESGNRANIWLVRGSEQDVVIDTGLGLRSLPEYLYSSGLLRDGGAQEDAGRRPLLAVATHVHFDHSGGLYQFDQVAVHRAEAEALARGDNFETVTWLSDSEVVRAPSPGWRARQFRVQPVQPTLILQDDCRDYCYMEERLTEYPACHHLDCLDTGIIAWWFPRSQLVVNPDELGAVKYRGCNQSWRQTADRYAHARALQRQYLLT